MSKTITEDMERFRALGKSAFVMGYTGQAGKPLVQELNKAKLFKKVVLIGRREIPLDVGPEFEQRVVDFEKIEDHKDVFANLDTGFCCLGAPTGGGISQEDYIRVNRDYCVSSAKVAKEQGCKHFTLVTGGFTNKNSWFLFFRVKGELEEQIEQINFDRLSIYRPGMLVGERPGMRATQRIAKALIMPIVHLFPTYMGVKVDLFAKAMINNVVRPFTPPVKEIFENRAIHQLVKDD